MLYIVKYPHPTLRHKSRPLTKVDADLKRLVREMFDLMYSNNGVGLAANQVNLPYRMFVMNPTADEKATDEEMVFLNPVISRPKGSAEQQEGCLSFPEIYADVVRPKKVRINAFDLKGNEIQIDADDFLARVVQHETDHLDGVVFVDRLAPTQRLEVRADLEELEYLFNRDQQAGRIPSDDDIAAHLAELERLRT